MSWRVAESLITLRAQINVLFPERNKESDGTIGDTNHQNRASDHNPWVDEGVVTALDITHDPDSGMDCQKLADALVVNKDPRIKYIIWNREICSSLTQPWVWRTYSGSNPHNRHIHISVMPIKILYDDPRLWNLAVKTNPAKDLQLLLNKYGANLVVDGIVGPKTRAALELFKADCNKINQLEKEI